MSLTFYPSNMYLNCADKKKLLGLHNKDISLSACDTDAYFENIQTILIFLKCYCCVSHLKYYKIIFFSWIINEEKYFLFHVSIKLVWKKHEIKKFFDCEIY